MRGGFPVGLVLGAFICAVMAFGVICSSRNRDNVQSHTAVVLSLIFACGALVLLIAAFDSRWLPRLGFPLLAASVLALGITRVFDLRAKDRR